jgi:hypothetical protein
MPSFLASTDTGGAGRNIHVRRSSWYFTWIVLLPCFHPSAACLLLTVLEFLSYKIFINYRAYSDWHFDPFFQWLTYAPFYALLAWEILRNRPQVDPQPVNQN